MAENGNQGGEGTRIFLAANPEEKGATVAFAKGAEAALAAWEARAGEILTVTAPDGALYRARMVGKKRNVEGAVCFDRLGIPGEVPLLRLCQALPEKERMELVLEKATELGVDILHPFVSEKSATLEERDMGQRKSHRWPHLIRRASRQCRRETLPALVGVSGFGKVLEVVEKAALALILDEAERARPLAGVLEGVAEGEIVLLVGPEGGFTRREIAQLSEKGAVPVSLGRRILRTETAAITGCALVSFLTGRFSWGGLCSGGGG